MPESIRLQDHYPESFHDCFGCGRRNPHGLQLSARVEGDEVVCDWDPQPHLRGAASVLHGGVVALLMDEIAGAAAFTEYHRQRGAALGSLERFDFVTASLNVDYLEPAPMDRTLRIAARVDEVQGRKIWVTCEIRVEAVTVSRGRLLFVTIPPERRAFSPEVKPGRARDARGPGSGVTGTA